MDERRGSPCRSIGDTAVTWWILGRYFALVVPHARSELRYWRLVAAGIDDGGLRDAATETLGSESLLAEAAAVFGLLVPAAQRPTVTRLTVAFQVLYDFVDTLGEQPGFEDPKAGMQLFRVLEVAVTPGASIAPEHAGGYLASLVATCQACVATLPSAATTLPAIRRAIRRCGESQSFTHAAVHEGPAQLAAWSARQERSSALGWWEVAGAAISSLAVHALFAAAAMPRVRPAEIEQLDAAYFPWACALSTLLDSAIDRAEDAAAERADHRVLAYYATDAEAARRVAFIAERSLATAARLPQASTHETIVLGVAAWYLSSPDARTSDNAPIADAVAHALGRQLLPPLAALRLRRRLKQFKEEAGRQSWSPTRAGVRAAR